MNKPLDVALALEARMRGVSRGQVLRDAGLETVVSTAQLRDPADLCPTCGDTGWVTLNEADLTPQEGGPEPDQRVCEDEYHDGDMSFLVWRLIAEYDEDMRRPPSFVTIEKLRALAALQGDTDAPDPRDATIARLTQALRVATHKPHDQSGEPIEGFPVCSVCGATQTDPCTPIEDEARSASPMTLLSEPDPEGRNPQPRVPWHFRLAALRQDRRRTLRSLGESVGVHFTYLSKIEQGHDRPSSDLVARLDTELNGGGELVWAFGGEPCPRCGRAALEAAPVNGLREALSEEEIIQSIRGYPDDRIAGPLWVKDPLGAYVRVGDLPAILAASRESVGAGLDELRALSDAATPGPWTERPNHKPYHIVVFGGRKAYEAGLTTSDIEAADARLIVAAVNFVRDHLDAAHSETEREAAMSMLADMRGEYEG